MSAKISRFDIIEALTEKDSVLNLQYEVLGKHSVAFAFCILLFGSNRVLPGCAVQDGPGLDGRSTRFAVIPFQTCVSPTDKETVKKAICAYVDEIFDSWVKNGKPG
ncbi:MAG: hypothetical protein WC824_14500 [Bacteroidota bacterium]|jgi:hypothetical protein